MCGSPIRSGSIAEPPTIAVSSLPLDDRGWPELILRVYKSGDRFCYRTAATGSERSDSPVLRVHPGERFAVRVVNEMDGEAAGADVAASALPACKPMAMAQMPPMLAAGYMNHVIESRPMPPMLENDVNMHFHGFEGPAIQENVFLSSLSTPAHACEFEIAVPRTQPPGTYFYHPHIHGISGDEVAGGLAGAWIVDPVHPQLPATDDHTVILKYRIPATIDNAFLPDESALYAMAGQHEQTMKIAAPISFDPFNPPPWPSAIPVRAGGEHVVTMCGNRPGNGIAVNGVDAPAELDVPSGTPQVLRVVNATSDSIVNLRMRDGAGHDSPLAVVARDGIPVSGNADSPLANFLPRTEVALVPAGRADLLLTLKPDERVTLYGATGCTAPLDEFKLAHDILTVRGGAAATHVTALVSTAIREADTPAAQLVHYARSHAALVRRRAITYTEYELPRRSGKGFRSAYFITQTSDPHFHEHQYSPAFASGAVAPAPDIIVKRGSVEEWYLFNTTMESHSFHIHQMSFVAESDNGSASTVDTVAVPFGKLLANPDAPDYPLIKPSVTRVLLDFRNVPRGTFLFHCHMLFHEDRGMMAVIRVE